MRVYLMATLETAHAVFRVGFVNLSTWQKNPKRHGVPFATATNCADDGYDSEEVTLCMDVPEDLFQKYKRRVPYGCDHRFAIIPADELNKLGKPQVYDCTTFAFASCAGRSRRELLSAAEQYANDGPDEVSRKLGRTYAKQILELMDFLDEIGWRNLVKMQEPATSS